MKRFRHSLYWDDSSEDDWPEDHFGITRPIRSPPRAISPEPLHMTSTTDDQPTVEPADQPTAEPELPQVPEEPDTEPARRHFRRSGQRFFDELMRWEQMMDGMRDEKVLERLQWPILLLRSERGQRWKGLSGKVNQGNEKQMSLDEEMHGLNKEIKMHEEGLSETWEAWDMLRQKEKAQQQRNETERERIKFQEEIDIKQMVMERQQESSRRTSTIETLTNRIQGLEKQILHKEFEKWELQKADSRRVEKEEANNDVDPKGEGKEEDQDKEEEEKEETERMEDKKETSEKAVNEQHGRPNGQPKKDGVEGQTSGEQPQERQVEAEPAEDDTSQAQARHNGGGEMMDMELMIQELKHELSRAQKERDDQERANAEAERRDVDRRREIESKYLGRRRQLVRNVFETWEQLGFIKYRIQEIRYTLKMKRRKVEGTKRAKQESQAQISSLQDMQAQVEQRVQELEQELNLVIDRDEIREQVLENELKKEVTQELGKARKTVLEKSSRLDIDTGCLDDGKELDDLLSIYCSLTPRPAPDSSNAEPAGIYGSERLQKGEIRLLVVYPAPNKYYPVVCALRTEKLEGSEKPKYAALSYWWGLENEMPVYVLSPEDTPSRSSDHVTGKEFLDRATRVCVRNNLFCALHRLRRRDRSVMLWVDRLCINQEDAAEKTEQLNQMMVDIYSK